MHVLAGCLQFTLTSWDKRKFESLGDKPGCLKDIVCDNNVVNIANITSVFRRNQWGLVGGGNNRSQQPGFKFCYFN